MMRLHWIGLLLLGTVPTTLFADPGLQQFFAQHCVKCHGPEEQNGDLRLDNPIPRIVADGDLLEALASVLEDGEMPPKDALQPKPQKIHPSN